MRNTMFLFLKGINVEIKFNLFVFNDFALEGPCWSWEGHQHYQWEKFAFLVLKPQKSNIRSDSYYFPTN